MYRVLIIGCGAIAGGYDSARGPDDWPLTHAGAISRDTRFELVACVEPDITKRNEFCSRWGVSNAYAAVEDLNRDSGLFDLIVIASPTELHEAHLEWALYMKPQAVFCEKPLAQNFEAIAKLANAYRQAAIPIVVNYSRRWQPDLTLLAGEIEDGKWGRLLSGVGTYSKGVVHNGSHMVDLMMMFSGSLEIHSVGPARVDHWSKDPTVDAVLVASQSNAPFHLVSGDSRLMTQFELVLNCEYGEIAIRDGAMRIETRRVRNSDTFSGYRQLGPVESAKGRYPETMTRAYDNLADVISGTDLPLWGKQNGYEAHRLCDTIRLQALGAQKDDHIK